MQASVYPVILAGGKGERFWPYSHSGCPKQLLPLTEERSMMEVSIDLARSVSGGNPIHLVIGSNLEAAVQAKFADVQDVIIVAEPEGRDTCAAVALATRLVQAHDPQGVMVVLTADHQISTAEQFAETVQIAVQQAASGTSLVTLGILPDRPETGFGYIELLSDGAAQALTPYTVARFVEKPDAQTAQEYVSSGKFLWNSGMFIWRVDYVWQLLKEHQPEMVALFENAGPVPRTNITDYLRPFFGQIQRISIDYGLLEKAPSIHCVPVSFIWDDLGSWTALDRVHKLDASGNMISPAASAIDCTDTMVFSTGKPVVAWGMDNVLVAEVDGVTLVCPKDKVPDLKTLLAELRKQGRENLL